jgi:hypothetical protein
VCGTKLCFSSFSPPLLLLLSFPSPTMVRVLPLTLLLTSALSVLALPKIERRGRYLYRSDDQSRSYIKGIAYQPVGKSSVFFWLCLTLNAIYNRHCQRWHRARLPRTHRVGFFLPIRLSSIVQLMSSPQLRGPACQHRGMPARSALPQRPWCQYSSRLQVRRAQPPHAGIFSPPRASAVLMPPSTMMPVFKPLTPPEFTSCTRFRHDLRFPPLNSQQY